MPVSLAIGVVRSLNLIDFVLFSGSSPADDHTPFLQHEYYSIFYVITRPFPTVWHKMTDNKDCLDFAYIERLNMLLRVFTAQYLQFQGV